MIQVAWTTCASRGRETESVTEWLTVLTSQVNKRMGADIYIYGLNDRPKTKLNYPKFSLDRSLSGQFWPGNNNHGTRDVHIIHIIYTYIYIYIYPYYIYIIYIYIYIHIIYIYIYINIMTGICITNRSVLVCPFMARY